MHRYDLIVARHLRSPSKAGAFRYAPTIVDVDDNELGVYRSIIEDRSTGFLRRTVLRRRVKSLSKIVPKLMSQSTCLWVSRKTVIFRCERASVLPNIPYGLSLPKSASSLPPTEKARPFCLSGCCRICITSESDSFLKESWPMVRKAVPDAILRLVGSRLNAYDRDRWAAVPGVEVAGFVQDLRDAYPRLCFCGCSCLDRRWYEH